MRRCILPLLLLGTALAACGPERAPLGPMPRANLVLISIDTLRADHLSCYGYARPTSPNLDAFASRSLLFERAFAQSNNTAPSHASMLSGVLPSVHGVRHAEAKGPAPSVPMLPELLHDAGYRTVAFADGGYVTEAFGFARGFDRFQSHLEPFDQKVDEICAFIERAGEAPTFLFVHTYGVHAPYLPSAAHDRFSDPAYAGRLRERVESMQAMVETQGEILPFGGLMRSFFDDSELFDEADTQYLRDLYDGCIHRVDAGVGRLLGALEEKGWLERSWVIVTSDHGEAFRDHGTFKHRQLYQEELHVPLIVRPPGGLASPLRVDAPVAVIDIAPTLLTSLGLPVPAAVQGQSLLPLDGLVRRPIQALSSGSKNLRAWLDWPHKLLTRETRTAQELELYDLSADETEQHDLCATTPRPEVVEDLLLSQERAEESHRLLREALGEPQGFGEVDAALLETLEALGYVR